MKTYAITVPIAGHAFVEVEAETEEQAHQKAIEEVTLHHIEEWEALEQFNQGNVCFCPHPWNIEKTMVFDEDGEPCDPL